MAKTIRTEVRKRTLMGKIIKWSFICFNVLMLVWMLSTCAAVGDGINNAHSDAEQAGTAIGGAMASGMQIFIWMAGDVILGILVLLTRGKKMLVDEVVE